MGSVPMSSMCFGLHLPPADFQITRSYLSGNARGESRQRATSFSSGTLVRGLVPHLLVLADHPVDLGVESEALLLCSSPKK
jgi:hypothetical protein